MNDIRPDRTKSVSLWVFVTGFAAAALLTLGAAVGASMLHRPTPEQAKSIEVPVAQR